MDSDRQSMALLEVYRIIYHGPTDHLRGTVISSDMETGFQFLFNDGHLDVSNPLDIFRKYPFIAHYKEADKQSDVSSKPIIESNRLILLNGPTEASIGVESGFGIHFYLFGAVHEVLSTDQCLTDDPEIISFPLVKDIMSEDGTRYLTVLYAIFENAVEAHLQVKITNVQSAFNLFGVVAARTSAIKRPAYSSILFFKESCEKIEVERGDERVIPLSRPFVGVPLGSMLILQFGLSSDDDDSRVEETLSIDVNKEASISSKYVHSIPCRKYEIKVEIVWRRQRKARVWSGREDS